MLTPRAPPRLTSGLSDLFQELFAFNGREARQASGFGFLSLSHFSILARLRFRVHRASPAPGSHAAGPAHDRRLRQPPLVGRCTQGRYELSPSGATVAALLAHLSSTVLAIEV